MLIDDNSMYRNLNSMIRPQNTDDKKLFVKSLFMEGLINFLEIYAESELFSGIEINLPLVSLYINSQEFENVDCSYINSIEDVYEILEAETLMGLPIWRFLILSTYQKNILESQYEKFLKDNEKYIRETYPCKRCVYFEELNTPFGYLSRCKQDEWSRAESVEWTKILKCKKKIGLDFDTESIERTKPYTARRIKSLKESLERKINNESIKTLDKYKVTLDDLKDCEISLEVSKEDKESEIWKDFGAALANKRTSTERRLEYKKAIILSSFIKFINLYIETEIGSAFKVNLYEVLKYIENEGITLKFTSEEEFYKNLEEMLIQNTLDLNLFIERKEY